MWGVKKGSLDVGGDLGPEAQNLHVTVMDICKVLKTLAGFNHDLEGTSELVNVTNRKAHPHFFSCFSSAMRCATRAALSSLSLCVIIVVAIVYACVRTCVCASAHLRVCIFVRMCVQQNLLNLAHLI